MDFIIFFKCMYYIFFFIEINLQSAFCIHCFCICGFNQPQIKKYTKKKNPDISKKQNLNLLHSQVFTFVSGIISNLDDSK